MERVNSYNPGARTGLTVPLSPSSMGLVAGKVTVGLVLHWPRITDISGSLPTVIGAHVRITACRGLLSTAGWLAFEPATY